MQVAKQISSRSLLLKSSHVLRNVCALNNMKETYTTTNYSKGNVNYYSTQLLKPVLWYSNESNALKCNYSKSSKPSKHHVALSEDGGSDSDSDSDSDNETRHSHRGESAFWRRKMRTFHNILDVNNDGVIAYDDFQLVAKNFASLGHLKPDAQNEFNEVMKQVWETLFGEITPYNLVNAEQYLTEMHNILNDKKQREKVHSFLPFLFKAVDKDRSGFISVAEYKLFFQCLGLTGEDAAISFAVIDQNSDGKLSRKEFVKLGREYFLSEDERKISRMFWGPLVLDH